MKRNLIVPFLLCAGASTTFGQSPIYGVDVRLDRFFTTDTADFVGNFSVVANGFSQAFYAIDFNAAADTLFAIEHSNSLLGTIDINSGAFTSLGITSIPVSTVNGMTADPDGVTWWVVADDPMNGGSSVLYQGDVVSGIFNLVGTIVLRPSTVIPDDFIDIACDSQGNLYGYSIKDKSLYSIDRTTGAGTLIGSALYNSRYAQGMDFDWSDDTLYATLYVDNTLNKFGYFNLNTGMLNVLQSTAPLHAEMEMAVKQPLPAPMVTFCDPADLNSTGFPTHLSGAFGSGVGSGLHLEATSGPLDQFGYFLVAPAFTEPGIAVSQGHLCLSGSLGRYNVPGSMQSLGKFDAAGVLQNLAGTSAVGSGFDVPSALPLGGFPAIPAGSTWHFQLWHREAGGNSNFSNGFSATF